MKVFVFSINCDDLKSISGDVKRIFEKDLKINFPSVDYMKGFADGYGASKIKIYTLSDYQDMINKSGYHDNYIYFVYVNDEDEDEDEDDYYGCGPGCGPGCNHLRGGGWDQLFKSK